MDRAAKLQRAQEKIARLAGRGLDVIAFWRACTPVLADAVQQGPLPRRRCRSRFFVNVL